MDEPQQLQFADYWPAPAVLEHLRDVVLLAVVGPSGVGKTMLIQRAMEQDPALHLVVVETSRPARADERDGVDYRFRARSEMLQRIERREYVQVAPSVLGNVYATAPESYTAHGLSVMAVIADAMPAFRALPFRAIRTIFIAPPSWAAWNARLQKHGFTPGQRTKRLAEARRSLAFGLRDSAVTYIVNDDVATAAAELLSMAHGHPLTPKLQAAQPIARAILRDLLAQLG